MSNPGIPPTRATGVEDPGVDVVVPGSGAVEEVVARVVSSVEAEGTSLFRPPLNAMAANTTKAPMLNAPTTVRARLFILTPSKTD
jgi:hypothetical protein